MSLDNYDGPYSAGVSGQTVFDFTDLSGGDHTVYVRDAQDCESEWNITFPETISFRAIAEIEYICDHKTMSNEVGVILAESTVDPSELDYSLDGGPFQSSNVFTNVTPGTNHYIEVRHTNGCIQMTDAFDIEDYDPLSLTLSAGDEAGEIIANTEGGTGGYQYTLNEVDHGNNNTFIVSESGIYQVVVTDSAGCLTTAQIEMEIIEPCIPDYFTPNDDGTSDGWTVECEELYPNLTFDIFDRYGRKIATLRVGEYWDGTYNGNELPTGDYWYVVKPNSSALNREYVGHFTLYR